MVVMGFQKQVHRVSIAMVLAELKDQAETVTDCRNALSDAIAARDDSIFELRTAGIPERTLMKLTGLSRQMINRIGTQSHTPVALDTLQLLTGNPAPTVRSTP